MIDVTDPGLSFYVAAIREARPLSVARYGDGEWSAIVRDRQTCIEQRLDLPGMREALMQSITRAPRDPAYWLACHPNQPRGNIEAWLRENQPAWLHWLDNRTFYRASMHGELFPFVDALRTMSAPLVIIGPAHLRKLSAVLPVAGFIEIPPVNAWFEMAAILEACEAWRGIPTCFSISAGPTSSPLVWRLFARGFGDGWLLDVGSLWDVYCGVKSRSYHNRINAERLWRNLEGA